MFYKVQLSKKIDHGITMIKLINNSNNINTQHLLPAYYESSPISVVLQTLLHLIFTTLLIRYCYYPFCTKEEAETPRNKENK